MNEMVFLSLDSLLRFCEQNGGDTEEFGLINPGGEIPFENWPVGTEEKVGLPTVLSLQEILDSAEENCPGHPLDDLTVLLWLEDEGSAWTLRFSVLTKKVVADMQRDSLN